MKRIFVLSMLMVTFFNLCASNVFAEPKTPKKKVVSMNKVKNGESIKPPFDLWWGMTLKDLKKKNISYEKEIFGNLYDDQPAKFYNLRISPLPLGVEKIVGVFDKEVGLCMVVRIGVTQGWDSVKDSFNELYERFDQKYGKATDLVVEEQDQEYRSAWKRGNYEISLRVEPDFSGNQDDDFMVSVIYARKDIEKILGKTDKFIQRKKKREHEVEI